MSLTKTSTPLFQFTRYFPLCALVALLPLGAHAIVRSWTGNGANNNWTTGGNWSTGVAPAAGDDLIFQGGAVVDATSLNNTNNFAANTVFGSITFTGTNYVLNGNQVLLTNSGVAISAQHLTGLNTVNLPFQFSTVNQTFECTASAATLVLDGNLNFNGRSLTNNCAGAITLSGVVSGTGDLVKTGTGTLLLGGAAANTYVGTTRVNAGTLNLDDTGAALVMVPGDLTIGNGASVVILDLNGDEIANTSAVTITGTGLLNLNGHSETIGSLTMTAGQVATGAGTLTLGGDITANASSFIATITGNLNLGAVTRTIHLVGGTANPDLTISAAISGAGGLVKTGPGNLRLSGANSYAGLTTVSTGFILAANATAFGSGAAGTVMNGGNIVLEGVTVANESLTNNTANQFLQAIGAVTSGWSSNIVLNADLEVDVFTGGTLDLSGRISGPGGITKSQTGTLIYSGSPGNNYTGDTIVNEGTLELGKATVPGIISGTLIIGDGVGTAAADVVRCAAAGQFFTAVKVVVNNTGLLDLNGFSDTVSDITMIGGDITTGAGTLTMNADLFASSASIGGSATLSGNLALGSATRTFQITNGPSSTDLLISAVISGSGSLIKSGDGAISLSGANTYTGTTTVNAGTFIAGNNLALGGTAGGTIVNGNAALILDNAHVTNEVLTLNSINPVGALQDNATADWVGPVTLSTNVVIEASSAFGIEGTISGPGGFTKIGLGTLALRGSADNTYTGPTVVTAGTLELDKSANQAINNSSSLTIGDDLGGLDADIVRYVNAQGNQIFSSVPIIINSSGLLDLNGHIDDVGDITFNGGHITTGTGTLSLNGNVTVNTNANGQAIIDGNLGVFAPRIFNTVGHSFSPDLKINAAVFGGGGITKNGEGELGLTASNSYTGLTLVNDGLLLVDHSFALGATNSGTVVNSGGALLLRFGVGVGLEPLTLAGAGQSVFGALSSSFGSNSWAGPVTLSANATISVDAGNFLNLSGPIGSGGVFDVTMTGTGTLLFSGSSANTFNNMVVNAGTLQLNKSIANAAFSGNLAVGDGAGTDTVRLLSGNQIPDTASVTLSSGAVFDLNDQPEQTGSIGGFGQLDLGAGTLREGTDNGSSTFSGTIIGTGQVFKLGTGTWTLNGTNSYSGRTTVSAGTLAVNGSQANSDITVNGTGTLMGDGIVSDLDVFGNLRPGSSPAILTTSNFVFRSSASDFFVELNGPAPGTGYDQVKVRGSVGLSNATLHATLAFQSAISNSFTIIDNDGADAVIGTFNGLAQNATLFINGVPFRISYTGGSGNDVVLTQLLGLPILNLLSLPTTNVVLSWPTNVSGFILEANTNLNASLWIVVSPPPVVNGTNHVVTNASSVPQKNYRLRNP